METDPGLRFDRRRACFTRDDQSILDAIECQYSLSGTIGEIHDGVFDHHLIILVQAAPVADMNGIAAHKLAHHVPHLGLFIRVPDWCRINS